MKSHDANQQCCNCNNNGSCNDPYKSEVESYVAYLSDIFNTTFVIGRK